MANVSQKNTNNPSKILTLSTLITIFSVLGFIYLTQYIVNNAYMPILVKCGVEDLKFEPISRIRIPSHDKIVKCRFVNLDNTLYDPMHTICTFDKYNTYIYAHVPSTYWSKTPSTVTTEIFKLHCQYTTDTYCPTSHIANPATHTSQLTVYPTGYHNISHIYTSLTNNYNIDNTYTDNIGNWPLSNKLSDNVFKILNIRNAKTIENIIHVSCFKNPDMLLWSGLVLSFTFIVSLSITMAYIYCVNTYQTLDDIIIDHKSVHNYDTDHKADVISDVISDVGDVGDVSDIGDVGDDVSNKSHINIKCFNSKNGMEIIRFNGFDPLKLS